VETRSRALVLRKVAYGEADVIVTLLARDQGKISALARAARRSQRRFGAALELARELSAPDLPEPELFELVCELYRTVARRGPRPDVLRVFELALLAEAGLAPVLDACVACGSADPNRFARGGLFDPARGGALCSECAPGARGGGVRPLPAGARALLCAAQRAGRADLGAVDLSGAAADDAVEARDAMVALLTHHVGHPLRTLEFMAKMTRPAAAADS
jgi:DNA repair protein RecO (recombination protein O)